MFFEKHRWEDALRKGVFKGIDSDVIRFYMSPVGREQLLAEIVSGQYVIETPHTALIPKDTPGEFRKVFINKPKGRLFLSIVNDILFEICPDMVHKSCTSYQKGIGCGKVVKKASALIEELSGNTHKTIGWKSDLSKYFDTVPIKYIDGVFDEVEKRHGHSVIIDIVRDYYHNDLYYDCELKKEIEHYQSLKQGCAVASFLADAVLYHVDEKLSNLDGFYVRYSDDCLFIGKDYQQAMRIMKTELSYMDMTLNPKKVEYLDNDHWFKFLGFAIKGSSISLAKNRIKTFVKEITSRTIKKIREGVKYEQALHAVNNWLYYGDGQHCWATGVLGIINVEKDINELNNFIMDCLRAVIVGKRVNMPDIGGLGWVKAQPVGCIARGIGHKIRTNRTKTSTLDNYYTLKCMRNNLLISRDLYDSVVRDM